MCRFAYITDEYNDILAENKQNVTVILWALNNTK